MSKKLHYSILKAFTKHEAVFFFIIILQWYLREAQLETICGEKIKIFTAKQMLQRLQIAHEQVKAGNTSEKILNEICQVIYSLYLELKIYQKSI